MPFAGALLLVILAPTASAFYSYALAHLRDTQLHFFIGGSWVVEAC